MRLNSWLRRRSQKQQRKAKRSRKLRHHAEKTSRSCPPRAGITHHLRSRKYNEALINGENPPSVGKEGTAFAPQP